MTENEVGAVVVVVNATDADSGLAGEIQYFITGMSLQQTQGKFRSRKCYIKKCPLTPFGTLKPSNYEYGFV